MMRAIGIPVEMFTVIFAIGRMPGWIANYREVSENEAGRIYRPAADICWRAAGVLRTHRSSRKGVRQIIIQCVAFPKGRGNRRGSSPRRKSSVGQEQCKKGKYGKAAELFDRITTSDQFVKVPDFTGLRTA
jgi:hypothetical protein